jgi:sensor histidine kinase YesM
MGPNADIPLIIIGCLTAGTALLSVIVFLLFKLNRLRKEQAVTDEKFRQLEKQIDSARLESLEANLNPHLLKNILNSIQSHAFQTYHTIDKLAGVLDYILYESRQKYVTPCEEIEFARNLIEINKIKLSPLFDLKVKLKINEQEPLYHQRLMAPLICANLIENAFKHADLQSPDSFISITFEFSDNTFGLTVANKISPKTPMQREKGGIGEKTFEQRLKIIYKENFKLDRFTEGDVYIAHLKIYLLEHKAKMLDIRR